MRTVEVYTGYTARPVFDAFHARTERFSELICHRRAGKTVAAVNDLQEKTLALKLPPEHAGNPPRFAYMAPTRVRAKDIAWQYLKRYSECIPGIKKSESELFIEYPNKGRVTVYGADNSRGMGLYLDGIVFDECDEIPPAVDDVIMPALADRKGWAVHMGILRGRHNLYKRFEKFKGDKDHFQAMLRASESKILDAEELARLKKMMGDNAYAMQMECDVNVSVANAIYGAQMDCVRREGRVSTVAFDPQVPIDFFFDIGHSIGGDDWSVWAVQLVNRDILAQAYFAKTGEVPAYYAGKCLSLANTANLTMGTVYLPHDGARKDRQGRTAVDDLRAAGIVRIKVVPRTPVLWDSINHLRALLPRFVFDSKRCGETWTLGEQEMPSGLDCLDYYTKKEDASTGIITDVPVHDQYSHGADALRTFAEAERLGMIEGTSRTAREHRIHPTKVLRGPGPQSYPIGMKHAWKGKVLR